MTIRLGVRVTGSPTQATRHGDHAVRHAAPARAGLSGQSKHTLASVSESRFARTHSSSCRLCAPTRTTAAEVRRPVGRGPTGHGDSRADAGARAQAHARSWALARVPARARASTRSGLLTGDPGPAPPSDPA